MIQPKRFLITTAIEETWAFDRPVLFLGEWTRLHARREVWQGLDAVVAAPVGVDRVQRWRDFESLQVLADRLLQELTAVLNAEHGVFHGERHWRIILGHWLSRYLSLAFNRYQTVERALADYAIDGTAELDFDNYTLATQNSLSFLWASNDKVWNHVFYSRALQHLGGPVPDRCTPKLQVAGYAIPVAATALRKGLRGRLVTGARRFLSALSRETDAVILDTHLSRVNEVLLQVSLGQMPQFWSSPEPVTTAVDLTRRKCLVDVSGEGFERFSRALLGEVLPTCFLEGYLPLLAAVDALPWPAKPKYIFTSNRFDVDEGFKLWTASKVEQGTAYFTGQHGLGYGSHIHMQTRYRPEMAASDAFLTWGWSDRTTGAVPAFIFNTAGLKAHRRSCEGGLLLVEASMFNQITHWDNYHEFCLYQEDQFRFAAALPKAIRRQLTVRLHGSHRKFEWADVQRWQERDPDIFIDTGAITIRQQTERSRLIVYAYNSTGILECLSLNIPVLGFWRDCLGDLTEDAQVHYRGLIEAGVLLPGPEAAAQRVADLWGNVGPWWSSVEVQSARAAFCAQFARSSAYPVRDLKTLLETLCRRDK